MPTLRETCPADVEYLEGVTTLLQRCRKAHPTRGLWEAAGFQWWWSEPRPTDGIALDPIVMPDASPDWVAHVIERGLAHAHEAGLGALDMMVDSADDVLFWFDPTTNTGLGEPMRTEDDHQRRGLARHVLTAGIERLAEAGAERIKIVFQQGSPAAKSLYLDVGFEPVKQTVVFSNRNDAAAGRLKT